MKSRLIIIACLFLCSTVSSGCVSLIVGGAVGALGGYAVSRDTIQGETDKDYNALWNTVVAVARMKGAIVEEDRARGYLMLETDPGYAIVRIIKLTKSTNRLRVKARKFGLPNLNLAEDIFIKILENASRK